MTRTWELLSFTNSPPKRVLMPLPTPSEKDPLTVHERPRQIVEQAIKAVERSQEGHRKSVQYMEKPQMSTAPRQVSSGA